VWLLRLDQTMCRTTQEMMLYLHKRLRGTKKDKRKEGRLSPCEGGRQFIFAEIRGRIALNRDNVKCEEQVVKDVGRMVRQNVTPRNSK